MNDNLVQVFIPVAPTFYVHRDVYVKIIDAIPAGYLTTDDAIRQFIAKTYGEKNISIPDNWTRTLAEIQQGIDHPYWRMVSVRGLIQESRFGYSMDERKRRLEAEGHAITLSKSGVSYQVHGYKERMFDLKKIANIMPAKNDARYFNGLPL